MSKLFYEKIGSSIALGFFILIVIIAGFSVLIGYQAHLSYRSLQLQLSQYHERDKVIFRLEYQIAQLRREEKNLMLDLNLPEMVASHISEWRKDLAILQQNLNQLDRLIGSHSKDDLHVIRENLARYQDGFLILANHIQEQKFQNSSDINRSFTPYKTHTYHIESTINKLKASNEKRIHTSIARIDDLRRHRLMQLAFVSTCIIICCVLLAYAVTKKSLQIGRQFAYQTNHDTLTGLLNRRGFELAIDQYPNGALLYLDLDQFKLINDLCGHSAGDGLLRLLAQRFAELIEGSSGILAHIEGDEYAIFLPEQDAQHAQGFAETIRRKVQSIPFIWHDNHFALNIAIGIAVKEPSSKFHELLLRANTASGMAKERGQGQIAHAIEFDQRHQQLQQDMGWAAKLPKMLEQDQFVLFYQQMLALQNAAGVELAPHAEILVRALDDQGKIVPPGLFLPAAERFNLINQIDRWVSKTLLDHHLPDNVVYGVNLSAASLADERFLNTLLTWVQQSPLPAERICFEITETAAMTDMTAAKHFMGTLKAQGCQFALDDFGSGFSSFSYLKDLPIDYLKIDGSLIRNIENNHTDEVMVTAIVQMAKALELKVIAEFVENERQIELLRRLGVDYAQGFVVHRPEALFPRH